MNDRITQLLNQDPLILQALREDISSEDVTTNAILRTACPGQAELICKQDGVIAGLPVFERTFHLLDPATQITFYCKDGDTVSKGQKLALLQGDMRVLLTGEISDELFGYKYTDFAPSAEEFQKEAEKRIRELHMYDVLRADRCISVNSLEARVPFGDLDFVEYVMALDPEMKRNHYGKGKYLLRHAFEGDYLPYDILMREKAAFSDAVGHSMVDDLKAYAETLYTDAEFEHRRKFYRFAQPFTKESLLYRELFERYYPGQAEMVADFWMPNKTWEGCNVQDPSARVLSNYGDSGK